MLYTIDQQIEMGTTKLLPQLGPSALTERPVWASRPTKKGAAGQAGAPSNANRYAYAYATEP
jgi:hypothetical protein